MEEDKKAVILTLTDSEWKEKTYLLGLYFLIVAINAAVNYYIPTPALGDFNGIFSTFIFLSFFWLCGYLWWRWN